MTKHPVSATYLDQQQARVSAALPAAGAYDATPTEMQCPSAEWVTLYVSYTRGAAGGRVQVRPDFSPDSTGAVWHQMSVYSPGLVAVGADTTSGIQREQAEYGATAAAIERFTIGPIELGAGTERLRVACRESGVVGTPGVCEVEARFGWE